MELYQTRYCSRLVRKSCHIECLLSLDHVNGQFIELRACAPDAWREELFYFISGRDILRNLSPINNSTRSNITDLKIYLLVKKVFERLRNFTG